MNTIVYRSDDKVLTEYYAAIDFESELHELVKTASSKISLAQLVGIMYTTIDSYLRAVDRLNKDTKDESTTDN